VGSLGVFLGSSVAVLWLIGEGMVDVDASGFGRAVEEVGGGLVEVRRGLEE
jgi:hypothetical protein